MASIIGAVHLIPSKLARQKPTRATGAYLERNRSLPFIGYESYIEYLKSPEWCEIRSRVLAAHPTCSCCEKPASQVHHYNYDNRVLLGLLDALLFSVCRACHEAVELDESGQKTTLKQAKVKLMSLLKKKYRRQLNNGIQKLKNVAPHDLNAAIPALPMRVNTDAKIAKAVHATKRTGDRYRARSANKPRMI